MKDNDQIVALLDKSLKELNKWAKGRKFNVTDIDRNGGKFVGKLKVDKTGKVNLLSGKVDKVVNGVNKTEYYAK